MLQNFLGAKKIDLISMQEHVNETLSYSKRTKPLKTARPPYNEIASAMAKLRTPRGNARGANEESATTVTPARRGPPRYRYLSFLNKID